MICSAINKANSDASDKSANRDEYDALRKRRSNGIATSVPRDERIASGRIVMRRSRGMPAGESWHTPRTTCVAGVMHHCTANGCWMMN
ncbi:hypothetical protein WJ39_22070 [Burkholderia diffusa]|nr:hypothetical protein WJ39_22070 [Burkholderia diffusa]